MINIQITFQIIFLRQQTCNYSGACNNPDDENLVSLYLQYLVTNLDRQFQYSKRSIIMQHWLTHLYDDRESCPNGYQLVQLEACQYGHGMP